MTLSRLATGRNPVSAFESILTRTGMLRLQSLCQPELPRQLRLRLDILSSSSYQFASHFSHGAGPGQVSHWQGHGRGRRCLSVLAQPVSEPELRLGESVSLS